MLLASLFLALPSDPSLLQPELVEALEAAAPGEHVPVIVVMQERHDTQALIRATSRLPRKERAGYVVDALRPVAEASQSELVAKLEELEARGLLSHRHMLWNINAHMVEATPAAIRELTAVEGVGEIVWDPERPVEELQDVAPLGGPTPQALPYSTSFEGGALPAGWEAYTEGSGQVTVTGSHGPSDGSFHALMDGADGTDGAALAILHVDLSTVEGATLTFDVQTFGTEANNTYDGLFYAINGGQPQLVQQFPDGAYSTVEVDLGLEILLGGGAFSNDVSIAFGWDEAGSAPGTGVMIDKISVEGAAAPVIPPTPNIVQLQAPELWDIGINGEGARILNIDSGTANTHPALAPAIWDNPGEIANNGIDDDNNGFVDDMWGWDFLSNDNNPYDTGHGNNTAGIVVGNGAGNGGVATGMAPGATLAAARINGEGDHIASSQYAAANGFDAITSSYSYKWPFSPKPNYHLHRQTNDVSLAAGVIHANSIGNQGSFLSSYPIPWNVSAPGNSPAPWRHPDQVQGAGVSAVMGCAGVLLGGDALYTSSGQGPSAWEDVSFYDPGYPHAQNPAYWDYPYQNGALPGLIKPDVCTYTNVQTTSGSSGYTSSFGGTSAATPHLGGALCLMISTNAAAPPRQISQALQETALDLGPVGKDLRYGAGKVQVYDAALEILGLATAMPHEPNPGEQVDIVISGPTGDAWWLFASTAPGTTPTGLGFDLDLAAPLFIASGNHTGDDTPSSISFTLSSNPALSGQNVYLQLLTANQGGATGGWLTSLVETVAIQ